jgi:cysteine desulfurase
LGRRARTTLDHCRERVAEIWRCRPSEVVFTSGGTESNNLAIFGAARALSHRGKHIVASGIEHHAVLNACRYLAEYEGFDLTVVPPTAGGVVDPDRVEKSIGRNTVLVSLMAANNETGVIQPVAEVGRICRERGVTFHTDAVQWFGKAEFECIDQFNADLVSFCAHKLYGPKGAGALFVRSPLQIRPVQVGGAQELDRRAGTENLAVIVGLAECVARFVAVPVFEPNRLGTLTSSLVDSLRRVAGLTIHGRLASRLPNTVSFSVLGCDSISLIANLDLEGVAASSGAACSSGSLTPSHVLLAMGLDGSVANSFVRFSLGRDSTVEEVSTSEQVVEKVVARIRASHGRCQ